MADREFTNINGIKVCDQTARNSIPTKTSQLENDSNFVTDSVVDEKISNAQLGGGNSGTVDLSGYVTKETGNASQITFADGQTFQTKLDRGTLKGDKGDKGDTGATGLQGEQGPQGIQGERGPAGADGLTTSIVLNGVTYTQQDGVITLPNISSGGDISSVTQIEPQELDMPKVFFYGSALPTTKDNVNLTMDYVSNTAKFSSFVKLKCQGTSSMSYAKKNFTVAMYSDEARATKLKKNFKGWGAQSKFCLKANYVDTTHTRNLSGARIAYDMVQSRPDSPFKQQLLQCPRNGAVDGFPIKLYFNGEFYGIYTWNIPKDGWMFNMDESNPNHMVLCAEQNNNGSAATNNSCQFRNIWINGDGGDWSVEVGTYSADVQNKFNRVISFVKDSSDEDFKANFEQYLDLYSLLDYYCFSYLVAHIDGLAKNMLMATYDGVIWGATLYDMDSIYGADWDGASFKVTNIQCPEQYQETNSLLWQRIEKNFATELYARYLELRQGALSLSNIVKHVEEIYDVIPDRVFADEKAKWTSLPGVNANTMTRFRNYMRDRAVYVDEQMAEIGTPKIECTGIALSDNTLTIDASNSNTAILTVTLTPENCNEKVIWSVSPEGIVTINNGTITAISNGECTVTATCGAQSATCNITVTNLASEYTTVDYIESTGTQYINTGVVFSVDLDEKVELDADMTFTKQYAHILGVNNYCKIMWNTSSKIFVSKRSKISDISVSSGRHTYTIDMADTTNTISIDGTNYTGTIGTDYPPNTPLLLLCGWKNATQKETDACGIGKIYGCKIYKGNELIRDMKPTLNSEGLYGLLDIVNNVFYTSEIDSFTGGNDSI